MRRLLISTAALAALMLGAVAPVAAGEPTCSDTLGIANHGQHIVGDYVAGIDHDALGWPPSGQEVAGAIAGEGAYIPGGPGPGAHFIGGVAPGASFCTDSNAPGIHL